MLAIWVQCLDDMLIVIVFPLKSQGMCRHPGYHGDIGCFQIKPGRDITASIADATPMMAEERSAVEFG